MKKIFLRVIFSMFFVFFVACGDKTPAKLAKEVQSKIYDGKGSEVLAYLYPGKTELDQQVAAELNKAAFEGKFQAASIKAKEKAQAKGGVKKIEIVEENIKEDKADVKIKIYFKNGDSADERLYFTNYDGKWYLNAQGSI